MQLHGILIEGANLGYYIVLNGDARWRFFGGYILVLMFILHQINLINPSYGVPTGICKHHYSTYLAVMEYFGSCLINVLLVHSTKSPQILQLEMQALKKMP